MALPPDLQSTTCSIYRPFGSTLIASGIACRHAARMAHEGSSALVWSDSIDVEASVDIRDGCTRTAGSNAITYADGDEVRIPDVSGSRYVVVWVELMNRGTPAEFKRAYLLRHAATWPGP